MNHMKNISFALSLLAVLALTVTAQKTVESSNGSGLLFEITHKDAAKPSYIFGTIHAICATDMLPMEKFAPYLDKTDELILEVDLDDSAQIAAMTKGVMLPDGKTFKQYLTAEEYAKVDEMVKTHLGISADKVASFKPGLLMITILSSKKAIGCALDGYDKALMKEAVAKEMPVSGLETAEMQIAIMDTKPVEQQAKELYAMALNPEKAIADLMKMTEVYKLQDAEKLLAASATQMESDKTFMTKLLDERNAAWITKLDEAVKAKPTFIAVGAAHLGGKNGVISLMKAKGYSFKAIKL